MLLTTPCERVVQIVDALVDSGLPADAVVLSRPSLLESGRGLIRVLPWHRVLRLALRRFYATLTSPASCNWRLPEFYRSRARKVIPVPGLNSDECIRAVKALDADIAVIGCAGILRPDVFESFRMGVLNIHPGFIPEHRGRCPVEWALVEGDDPGVTLHFIDAGVDTGPVVARRAVPLQPGDTIGSVYRRADRIGIELLVAALNLARSGEEIPCTRQPVASKPAHRSMPQRLLKVARRRLIERVSREAAPAEPSRTW
ncbi:MAG: formyl transferase [Chloroflexota bacterium]